MGDSESPALPLGDTPIEKIDQTDFIESLGFCKRFFLRSIFSLLFSFRRLEHFRIEKSLKCSEWESCTSKYSDHTDEDDSIHSTTQVLLCPSPVSCDIMYLISVSHSRYTESDEDESEEKIHTI